MYHTNLKDNKREQLRKMMDDFTTFSWGYHNGLKNAFEEFGAFIVGGKNDLKFYNGPGFSNKYVQTQYQSQSNTLQDVEFKNMTISFTMGVYWFTIEEYRRLLLWLHPYEINSLSFSFAPEWYYLVKLANISDSTRMIVGRDSNGDYRYYTEIKLTFDVQGEPVAHRFDEYSIDKQYVLDRESAFGDNITSYSFPIRTNGNIQTDLDTPFEFSVTMIPSGAPINSQNIVAIEDNFTEALYDSKTNGYYLALSVEFEAPNMTTKKHTVFEVFLKNLSWGSSEGLPITFTYDSSQGFVFLNSGDKFLSSQTTNFSGNRILEALSVSTFKLPGVLESGLPFDNFKNMRFVLYFSNNWYISRSNPLLMADMLSRARTNVI